MIVESNVCLLGGSLRVLTLVVFYSLDPADGNTERIFYGGIDAEPIRPVG